MDYDYLHCSNKKLIEELKDKEEFFYKIAERIRRCPICGKGHFVRDGGGSEYDNFFWACDECGYFPNENRECLIEDIAMSGEDDWWSYAIFEYVNDFEYGYNRGRRYDDDKKVRKFDPVEWEKEKEEHDIYGIAENLTWKELVEKTIKDHIKNIDKAIELAKKVPMLKTYFKNVNPKKVDATK